MIRKMDDTMQRELLEWLQLDVPLHLPVIGDIVRHGMSAVDREVWVQCDAKGIWTALIRRFFDHYILCVPVSGSDMEELGYFLRFSDPLSISGASQVIRQVQPLLDGFSEEVARQMILTGDRRLEFYPANALNGIHNRADAGAFTVASWCSGEASMVYPDMEQLSGAGLAMGMANVGDAGEIGALIFETDAFRRNFHSAARALYGKLGFAEIGEYVTLRSHS